MPFLLRRQLTIGPEMGEVIGEYILIMGGYKFRQIISSIHQGSEIQLTNFKDSLSSHSRLKIIRQRKINFTSVPQLIKGLISINLSKFMLCLLFFGLTVAITVSSPFIINFIMCNLIAKQDFSLLLMVFLIISYKSVASAVSIVCNILYESLGFEYFAYLYWHILNNCKQAKIQVGKRVNIVEYDCNMLTNIVYSTLTSIFYFLEIMVLFGLLISYMTKSQPYSMFFLLISAYLVCQCLVSLATFALNRTYMNQKDRRLGVNVSENNDQRALRQREKQLKANKRFLLMKMVSKLVSLVFPILINVYVFLIADRSIISQNEYTILILINLLRSPIAELMTAMNLSAEILTSCKRIIEFVNGLDLDQNHLLNKTIIEEDRNMVGGQLIENKQKGDVCLQAIWTTVKQRVAIRYWLGLLLLYLCLVGCKYYSNFVTKHIIADDCQLEQYIGLTCQVLLPISIYLVLIVSIQKVAASLFARLKQQIDYEILNRISGDIAAVDRTVTINAFEIGLSLATILGSYLYSIISLKIWWLEALLVIFLGLSIWAAFTLNRFVMRSRREVARRELEMKSSILKGLLQGKTIRQGTELRGNWYGIFECKEMGLFIQNYYTAVVSALMLVLSLVFILLSQLLVQDTLTKSILLVVCLGIDRDLTTLFFALVRLQLSLVSFQRVINALTI